jgi:ATP-dependent 26S proteasome regulatory subunit
VVQFNADWSNHDVMLMFSSVPHRCIVLFEDFDNHFHGRQPAIKNDTVKFTFDSVINSLDGVHNYYHQVVFIMTVNNITKVDESLKDRPSRFKFVREFGPPPEEVRRRILGDENLVKLSKGMSLDKVCLAADHPGSLMKSSGENLQVEMVF